MTTPADNLNPPVADDWLIVTEALEAAGWTGADDNPLEILKKDGATWAIANECCDSGLSKDGWTVEFPSDTPVSVVIAACLAAAPDARQVLGTPTTDPAPDDLAAAYASCPGYETSPNPCRCPCYGCKHHCSAHQPASARAAPADRATDRRDRYADAILDAGESAYGNQPFYKAITDAVMAVADTEQTELRAEMERRTLMLQASRNQVAELRRLADEAQPTETEALCGNTVGVSGLYYRPCARLAGHTEAYCRDITGQHLFLPATAAAEEPQP